MAIHYFHCTDGTDLILDRSGREALAHQDVLARARSVAREVMQAVPNYDEWENWSVHVYDERGQLEIVPFREAGRLAAARPEAGMLV
jgi:hypothetical protein